MGDITQTFILVILSVISEVNAATTTFDKEAFTIIDESTLSAADATEYADTASCGSKLYKKADELGKNLAVNIRTEDWSAASSAEYFRAHPAVTTCIQAVFTKVYKLTNERATMLTTYEPVSVTASYPAVVKKYISSGCGVKMAYKDGTGDLKMIAKAALMTCTMKFEAEKRDIGVHVLSDSVLIYMTGNADTAPSFDGITLSEARGYINDGLVPQKIPDCSTYDEVSNGFTYPESSPDPTSIVGAVDVPINSTMEEDLRRLMQYLGTNVEFEDDNSKGCDVGYNGNDLATRCHDRLMTSRMYDVIYYLKSYVLTGMGSKIKITEAWDDGTENPDSLHTEGRAVKVTYPSANTAANLQKISQLAVCAKADYVAHKGDHLLIAVKKQKGRTEQTVQFTELPLTAVEAPSIKASSYSLLEEMASEEDEYPLFDSDGRLDVELEESAPISKFVAKDTEFRYFRVHPAIAKCYSKLVYQENKWDPDGNVEIEVVRAFMSNEEELALIQPSDERYNRHTLGQALDLKYAAPTVNRTVNKLLTQIIDVCSPIFDLEESNINIGLYTESVFVSMDDEFVFWANDLSLLPTGYNTEISYSDYLKSRRELAIQGRIVDPDFPEEACNEPYVPERQRLDYKYKEPRVMQLKRRRKRATGDECVPTENTAFCKQTLSERQTVVDTLWNEMSVNKHVYHEPKSELKTALEGCLLTCGTCLEGAVYEKKLEHCSNLIHWAPFELLNTAKDMSNIYAKDNMDTYSLACEGSGHCLVRAPLFSQLAPFVKKTFRPDPERSVVEEIYSSEENPSPLIRLMEELYAVHAIGIVKFWVADESEITSMQETLEAAMMYNPNASSIHIYVTNEMSKSPVQAAVESYARKMSVEGCPTYTRPILVPYEILDPPENVRRRRDLRRSEYDYSHGILMTSMNWETVYFDTQEPT